MPPDLDLLPEGGYPYDATISPDGSELWVCGAVGDGVVVIDTATLGVDTVFLPAGADPRDVDISEDCSLAYVPSGDLTGDDAVYVIDLATAATVDTIDVGPGNPNVVAVAPQRASAVIFADGFESGDTSAWTFAVP